MLTFSLFFCYVFLSIRVLPLLLSFCPPQSVPSTFFFFAVPSIALVTPDDFLYLSMCARFFPHFFLCLLFRVVFAYHTRFCGAGVLLAVQGLPERL